jgi:small subunit ribosomal protein S20
MANTPSAKKQHRKSVKQRFVNLNSMSRIKTLIKKFITLTQTDHLTEARTMFPKVQSEIMKGVQRRLFKMNTASRKVSSWAQKIKNS